MPDKLLEPALYRPNGPIAHGVNCSLLGGRCRECSYVVFPMQRYGCEQCGATGDALEDCELSGAGVLVSSATVHMHCSERRQVPFIIGAVRLNDVRALLEHPCRRTLCGQPIWRVDRHGSPDRANRHRPGRRDRASVAW